MHLGAEHIFVFQKSSEKTIECINSTLSSSGYKKIELDTEQKDWFYKTLIPYHPMVVITDKRQKKLSNSGQSWKMYHILEETEDYTYLTPLHNRAIIDVYFGNEIAEISKYIDNEILYFWVEHATTGYELFKNGKSIKKINYDTHGPYCEIDGKEIPLKIRKDNKETIYEYPEASDILLPVFKQELFTDLDNRDFNDLIDTNNKIIMFLNLEFPNINSYIEKTKKEILEREKYNQLASWIILLAITIGIILSVYLKILGFKNI